MINFFSKYWLFLKTGLAFQTSYKFGVFVQFAGIFSQMVLFFFIAKLVSPEKIPELSFYNNDYFAFVLIGIAFSGYFAVAMGDLAGSIKEEQSLGTLESLALAPEPLLLITIWTTGLGFLKATLNALVYLLLGFALFDLTLPNFSLLPTLILLLVSLLAFLPLGILGAAFILVFKQGNPIHLLYSLLKFISGVYFPITLFPDWLVKLVYLQPLAPALTALRKVVLGGAGLAEVSFELKWLVGFTLIMLPVSLWSFQLAYRKARLAGSLAHY